jgi:hypothetical protein
MTSRWGDSTDASKCACGIFAAVAATENEAAMNQQEISKTIIAISPSSRSLLLFPSNYHKLVFHHDYRNTHGTPPQKTKKKTLKQEAIRDET